MGELLGALGLAWPRLLIYPGGLSALGLAWLLAWWMAAAGGRRQRRGPHQRDLIVDVLPPLLALTLLPLPPARAFPYGIDLVAALALLGWPRLHSQASAGLLARPPRWLAMGYGLQVLGAALMGSAADGIELSRLVRAPASATGWALSLGGAALWLAGQAAMYDRGGGWAGRLGELGQLYVGGLPLLAALVVLTAGRLSAETAGWALPPLALIGAALVLRAARRLSAANR